MLAGSFSLNLNSLFYSINTLCTKINVFHLGNSLDCPFWLSGFCYFYKNTIEDKSVVHMNVYSHDYQRLGKYRGYLQWILRKFETKLS